MALLYLGVDSGIINLIGYWRRNEMLRYLGMQAESLMRNFSRHMLTYGNYYFLPHL